LEARGKHALVVNGDAVPKHIAFMDPAGKIGVIHETAPLESLRGIEALIIVDTSAWAQLGPMSEVVSGFAGSTAIIDHHLSEDEFDAVVLKDSQAEATGRLILELTEALDVRLTEDTASMLFAAIATDTGWFRFSSVTDRTFEALAKLTAAGASPARIFTQLFEQHSLPRLSLRGRILDHIESECDGRFLWTYVSKQDFETTGAQQTDTEDSINQLLTVAGVEAAAMFVELAESETKVSLRSRTDFDVRQIAEQFGGGGHRAAAGITIASPMSLAQQQVLDAVSAAMEDSSRD
jgi:phosphoesterase RecJ-like protein